MSYSGYENPKDMGRDAYNRGEARFSFRGNSIEAEYEFHKGWDEAEQKHSDDIEEARYIAQQEYEWYQRYEKHEDYDD
jgi:hypothetical protein